VCERLRARIADEPITHDGRAIRATLSLGASVYAAPYGEDAVGLVRAADVALYRAKSGGRNRVELA
jgi:diguanylate cyclase (GGDEF)-like protein